MHNSICRLCLPRPWAINHHLVGPRRAEFPREIMSTQSLNISYGHAPSIRVLLARRVRGPPRQLRGLDCRRCSSFMSRRGNWACSSSRVDFCLLCFFYFLCAVIHHGIKWDEGPPLCSQRELDMQLMSDLYSIFMKPVDEVNPGNSRCIIIDLCDVESTTNTWVGGAGGVFLKDHTTGFHRSK